MRVFDRNAQQVAEFDVPFPDTSSTPEWTPDPLPVTKTDTDVRVTFSAVDMQEQPPLKLAFPLDHPRRGWRITPVFSVERNGVSAPEWKSDTTTLTDALGNTGYSWDCRLSPHERAWKLEMQLSRDDPAAFGPDEIWESPLIPLPAVDSSQSVHSEDSPATAKVQQVTVTLQAIGRGATTYKDFATSKDTVTQRMSASSRMPGNKKYTVSHSSSSRNNGPTIHTLTVFGESVHLLLKLEHLPKGHREFFRVHDDQGRELPHYVESLTMKDAYYGFIFVDPADDVQSLRVTAYVHTARTVELLVAPPAH